MSYLHICIYPLVLDMEISEYTSWIMQIAVNSVLIIFSIYIFYTLISLIEKVRKGKKVDRKKVLRKILILTLITLVLFVLTTIFFQYDPFNVIEDPMYEDILVPFQ